MSRLADILKLNLYHDLHKEHGFNSTSLRSLVVMALEAHDAISQVSIIQSPRYYSDMFMYRCGVDTNLGDVIIATMSKSTVSFGMSEVTAEDRAFIIYPTLNCAVMVDVVDTFDAEELEDNYNLDEPKYTYNGVMNLFGFFEYLNSLTNANKFLNSYLHPKYRKPKAHALCLEVLSILSSEIKLFGEAGSVYEGGTISLCGCVLSETQEASILAALKEKDSFNNQDVIDIVKDLDESVKFFMGDLTEQLAKLICFRLLVEGVVIRLAKGYRFQ